MKENKSNGLDDIISQAIEEISSSKGIISLWKRSIWQSWSVGQAYPVQNCGGSRRMALPPNRTGWKGARLLIRF